MEASEPSTQSPFLHLARELRDQIYDYVFALPDDRDAHELRIERRHLSYFKPTPCNVLLLLRHEYLLLNRQIAAEALEVLLKKHTLFFSCGPFVLNALLAKIEKEEEGCGREWLRWIKRIELDWTTFPNLRHYPPEAPVWKATYADHFGWGEDGELRACSGDDDGAWDFEGERYDDNLYDPGNVEVWGYPAGVDGEGEEEDEYEEYEEAQDQPNPSNIANDPFGFSTHYPFANPQAEPDYDVNAMTERYTNLDLLVENEVTPLFEYLSSPTFRLSSVTVPLYFISTQLLQSRRINRPGYVLPLELRFWVQVAAHAILLLTPPANSPETLPALDEVRIKLLPWDVWASMDPADNLANMVANGIIHAKEGKTFVEGEAFNAVQEYLESQGAPMSPETLDVSVSLVEWKGELRKRVGDELEVVVRRKETT